MASQSESTPGFAAKRPRLDEPAALAGAHTRRRATAANAAAAAAPSAAAGGKPALEHVAAESATDKGEPCRPPRIATRAVPAAKTAAASSTGQRQPRKGRCAGRSPHPAVPMHGAHRPHRTRAVGACVRVGSPLASCQKELCSGGSQDLRRPQGGKLELGGGELSATLTATATATFGRAAREARCATPGTAPSTFVPLALLLLAALFSRGQGAII